MNNRNKWQTASGAVSEAMQEWSVDIPPYRLPTRSQVDVAFDYLALTGQYERRAAFMELCGLKWAAQGRKWVEYG